MWVGQIHPGYAAFFKLSSTTFDHSSASIAAKRYLNAPGPEEDAVILHRIDPSRNMRRFYRLDVQPDLFGFWLLIREWGRIGKPGQTRIASFASRAEALDTLQHHRRAKEGRGYADTRRIGVSYRIRNLIDPWQWMA
jgi:predicted DNA-binding WGR domain protein